MYCHIGSRMKLCVNSGLPIAMIPCLHQSNIDIKRKLLGRWAQKYNHWVGEKRVQTSMGQQSTCFHISPYKARKLPTFMQHHIGQRKEICVNSGLRIIMVPCLHQSNNLYQKEAMGKETPKYDYWVSGKRLHTSTSLQITRFHIAPYRVDNGNFHKFEATYSLGTMFAP